MTKQSFDQISFAEIQNRSFKIFLSELFDGQEADNILFNFSRVGESSQNTGALIIAVINKLIACIIVDLNFITSKDKIDIMDYSILTYDSPAEVLAFCGELTLQKPFVAALWLRENLRLVDLDGNYLENFEKQEICQDCQDCQNCNDDEDEDSDDDLKFH